MQGLEQTRASVAPVAGRNAVVFETARAAIAAVFVALLVFVASRTVAPGFPPFGFSRSNDEMALAAIVERFPATLQLVCVAVFIALVAGSFCAFLAARSSRAAASYAMLALHSIPYFWLLLVLEMAFARLGVDGMSGPLRLLFPSGLLALYLLPSVVDAIDTYDVPGASGRERLVGLLLGMFVRFGDGLPAFIAATMIVEILAAWPGDGRVFLGALQRFDPSFLTTFVLLSALFVLFVRFLGRLVCVLVPTAVATRDV